MRTRRWPLAALLVATLAIKAIVLVQLGDHPLLQPHGELDTATYVDLAHRVAADGPLGVRDAFFVSPLYVYFLAAVFAAGGSLSAARAVQIALGTAAVGLVFATTRRWFGARGAWIAAALAAGTGLFTFYEILILQAALDPFLTAGTLYLLTRAQTDDRAWPLAAAGASMGLLVLNRPNAMVYALVVVALTGAGGWRSASGTSGRPLRQRLWRAAAVAAGISLVLLPNALRNYLVSGEVVLISSHGGLNFAIGNSESADGTYQRLRDITPSIAGQVRDSTLVAESVLGRRLSPGEVSAYFYDQAWTWMASHPWDAATLTARKAMLMLNRENVPLNFSYAYYSRDEPTLLRVLVIGPWLLIPLGLTGLVLRGARRDSRGYWTWGLFVPVYGLSVVAFFVSSRYRLPWLIPLCATSGAAIAWTFDQARSRNAARLRGPAVAVLCLAVVTFWPLKIDDRRSGERTRKVVWLVEQGQENEAIRLADEVAAEHPYPASLRHRLAEALATAGRFEAAIDQYRKSLELDPAQPAVQLALGQALVVANRPAEAVPHLTQAREQQFRPGISTVWLVRALALAGQQQQARDALSALPDADVRSQFDVAYDLGVLALELDSPAQAVRCLEAALALAPDHADAHEQLGVARLMLGQPAGAIAPLEQACRLRPSGASAHLNLAVAYAAIGRVVDARRAAEEALRLDPKEPRTQALLRSLPARP